MGKRNWLLVSTLFLFGLGFSVGPASSVWAQQGTAKPTLGDADCAKCQKLGQPTYSSILHVF
jgi:hypothetical protein